MTFGFETNCKNSKMFVIRKKSVFVGKNVGKVATFVGAKDVLWPKPHYNGSRRNNVRARPLFSTLCARNMSC
jgi:hypothetical protein